MIGCGWVHPPSPLPAGVTRVEVVHNATINGQRVGDEWRIENAAGAMIDCDLAAFDAYCRRIGEGKYLVIDIEAPRNTPLNADVRFGPVHEFIRLALQMVYLAHSRGVLIGFYDCFREEWDNIADGNAANVQGLRNAMAALAPVIDACDFFPAKTYAAGTDPTRPSYFPRAIDRYIDHAIAGARGKPVYVLSSASAFRNDGNGQTLQWALTDEQQDMIIEKALSRADGLIMWQDHGPTQPYMGRMLGAAVEQAAVRED